MVHLILKLQPTGKYIYLVYLFKLLIGACFILKPSVFFISRSPGDCYYNIYCYNHLQIFYHIHISLLKRSIKITKFNRYKFTKRKIFIDGYLRFKNLSTCAYNSERLKTAFPRSKLITT